MVERRRGHIVAIASLASLFSFPGAMIYTTSKAGVRGFMEALTIQLAYDGHDKYIRTSIAFPYFTDSNPYIANAILEGCKQKVIHKLDFIARGLTEGILREDEVIALPKEIYALYLL